MGAEHPGRAVAGAARRRQYQARVAGHHPLVVDGDLERVQTALHARLACHHRGACVRGVEARALYTRCPLREECMLVGRSDNTRAFNRRIQAQAWLAPVTLAARADEAGG